jgi:hypothetical protein
MDEWPAPQGWNPFVQLAQAGLITRISGTDTGAVTVVHRVQGTSLRPDQVRAILMKLTSNAENYSAVA